MRIELTSKCWRLIACLSLVGLMSLAQEAYSETHDDEALRASQFLSAGPKASQPRSDTGYLANLLAGEELGGALPVPSNIGAQDSLEQETVNSPSTAGSFPALPPDPYDDGTERLPPVEDELWYHGGSYLYAPEGDQLGWPGKRESHHDVLRLPADWKAPEPITAFAEFLGADPIQTSQHGWRGPGEYTWEPRFVANGNYETLGFAVEQAGRRQDAIGHNLVLDLDLRLTGTERFHVQFRPLGRRNTGGSFYQFSEPDGYVNNATGEPDRYWFEGEIHSLFGWCDDYFAQRYYNVTAGKFPYVLHNSLLINDEILGGILSQNNIVLGSVSNLNVQLFAGINDVDTYRLVETQVYGVHASVDYKRIYYEATYAYLNAEVDRDSHYVGASGTRFFGPYSLAMRGLFKFGDRAGTGSGQLVTVETNWTRVFEHAPLDIHHGVFFCNAFWAARGWNSISGGNLNRLRTAFEVDPLVRLAAGPAQNGTVGVSLGVQLFRHHEDESITPEVAWESPEGESVLGVGLKYQKKLTTRSFLDVLGVVNWSDASEFERQGVFISHQWIF